jgi:hypothetical protein
MYIQVEFYRVGLTLFWIRSGWPHVVEIHVQVDIYRVVLTLFGLGWVGHMWWRSMYSWRYTGWC